MLNGSGKSRGPCFVPGLRGKAVSLPPLIKMFAVGFSQIKKFYSPFFLPIFFSLCFVQFGFLGLNLHLSFLNCNSQLKASGKELGSQLKPCIVPNIHQSQATCVSLPRYQTVSIINTCVYASATNVTCID